MSKKKLVRKNRFSILDILYIISVSRKNCSQLIEAVGHAGTKRNFFGVSLGNSPGVKIRRFSNFDQKCENYFFFRKKKFVSSKIDQKF